MPATESTTSSPGPSFEVTPAEHELIGQCAIRAVRLTKQEPTVLCYMEVAVDLMAVHANGCPLDFHRLLDLTDFDFIVDVSGIKQYIDRNTGKLTKHFLPRCAVTQTKLNHGTPHSRN